MGQVTVKYSNRVCKDRTGDKHSQGWTMKPRHTAPNHTMLPTASCSSHRKSQLFSSYICKLS